MRADIRSQHQYFVDAIRDLLGLRPLYWDEKDYGHNATAARRFGGTPFYCFLRARRISVT
jgi:hypothetical protein